MRTPAAIVLYLYIDEENKSTLKVSTYTVSSKFGIVVALTCLFVFVQLATLRV